MALIGIMQGRLTLPVRGIQAFPRDHWRDEFPAAKAAGIDFIEWIFDLYGADVNPLMTDEGQKEMRALMAANNVAIESICADYFMDLPLLKCSPAEHIERMKMLETVFNRGKMLGVKRIVLPFVDASALDSETEIQSFIKLANEIILPMGEKTGIEVHLETSLPPLGVAELLAQIPHPFFWINYDSGNSSSLGFKPEEEFEAYGKRIGSFHVKDRKLGSTTVALGTGDTDFPALAKALKEYSYARSYVLQVARGTPGDEISWAKQNRAYTEKHLLKGAA